MTNKVALVTGASSGIGKATAEVFADYKFDVIICGRRQDRLEELADELQTKVNVYMLTFDVSNQQEVNKAIGSLPKSWQNIDILVNNAGNAHGLAPIQDGDVNDWDAMIDINVKGLLYVTKAIIPQMVNRKTGQVVHVGSLAGKEAYPNGNVYCASKHAVDAINKGMRMDLHKHGIRVSAINPGLVETEFSKVRFKGDEEKAKKTYQGYQPLTATDIAETILFMVTRPAHVNIADLLILPTAQASATIVNKKN
ncbi:SDR family NAD(P)-dependent oxidoreductase [uncultured Microscilla sp.]|uniref:SDR family NAD(P)-dependent oxidoreductase n=1 Tax=uncultured Microscilla sp. TaxID=432653 RepID=UPI0026126F46|nr:SDR family NAD(P)-dependent oxidoreductase [uncultured Microscilla sp.]